MIVNLILSTLGILLLYLVCFFLFGIVVSFFFFPIVRKVHLGFFKTLFSFRVKGVEIAVHILPVFAHIRGKGENKFFKEMVSGIVGVSALFLLGFVLQILSTHYLYYPETRVACKVKESAISVLQPGDVILALNEVEVKTEAELESALLVFAEYDSLYFSISRENQTHLVVLENMHEGGAYLSLKDLGLILDSKVWVQGVSEDSPAARSGLLLNDTILQINEVSVTRYTDIQEVVEGYSGSSAVVLQIKRGDSTQPVEVTPQYSKEQDRYLLGIKMAMHYPRQLDPGPGMKAVIQRVWRHVSSYYASVFSVRYTVLSGPTGIFNERSFREEVHVYVTLVGFTLWRKPLTYLWPIFLVSSISAISRRVIGRRKERQKNAGEGA